MNHSGKTNKGCYGKETENKKEFFKNMFAKIIITIIRLDDEVEKSHRYRFLDFKTNAKYDRKDERQKGVIQKFEI